MSRPRKDVRSIVIPLKLTLTPGIDDDLILDLASIPKRQRAARVIARMRSGVPVAQEQVEDDDGAGFLDDLAL
jgi:hypothetical protein